MRELNWYLNRLKTMSASEVAARALDSAMVRIQRAGFLLANDPPKPSALATKHWLGEGSNVDSARYAAAAQRVMQGHIRVFARELDAGGQEYQWNRDPLTGISAPMSFGLSMDLHARGSVGDIKYLWEPNRHLHLVAMAQAFALTRERRYLDGFRSLLGSWLAQCPYPLGPNWSSGLELAIRLINWSVAWQLLGGVESPIFEGEAGVRFRDQWLRSIYQHVHFIRGHYSRFSSANNHRIGEAAGVFVAACTWPLWREFERWQKEAYEIVSAEALAQVGPDGVDREQTTSYQRFVLEFFVLCIRAGRAAGCEFPSEYHARVRAMLGFLAALMDSAGHLPMIGDADDGCVLRLSQEPDFCPYRSILATGAVMFQAPEFAQAAGRLDDATRWLLADTGWDKLTRLGGSADGVRLRTAFADGGYYVLGRDLGAHDEIRMLVDAGALGYLGIAAHGHADALAIYLSVAGHEILVDPGTYTYHGNATWREYFRGTRAHNTLTVDGQDQSIQGGGFLWLSHANSRCLLFECEGEKDHFVGEHDGYRRLSDPVLHQREIRRNGHVFEIVDRLECRARHTLEQWWHFSEACDVRIVDGGLVVENGAARVRIAPERSVGELHLYRGSEDPIAGWVSRSYDVKVPSSSACLAAAINGSTTLRTRIECTVA